MPKRERSCNRATSSSVNTTSNSSNLQSTPASPHARVRSEEHTSELQSRLHLVCRLLLEKEKKHHTNSLPRPAALYPPNLGNPPSPHTIALHPRHMSARDQVSRHVLVHMIESSSVAHLSA